MMITIEDIKTALESETMVEAVAAWDHDEAWSGWMKYMREKSRQVHPSGEWYELRWLRQSQTKYKDLSSLEQDSDRIEAKNFLAVVGKVLEEMLT